MAKIDYVAHQKEYERLYEGDPSLSVSDYCELNGLKYASARRYIKRPKSKPKADEPKPRGARDKSSCVPKLSTRRTPAQQKWANYFKDFLVRATKNPTLSMAEYAKEKGLKAPSVRKQFKLLRDDPDFSRLVDLYDEQCAKMSDARKDKRRKTDGKPRGSAEGAKTPQSVRTTQNEKGVWIDPCADVDDPKNARPDDIAQLYRQIMMRGERFSNAKPTNDIHGGYSSASRLVSEMLEIISEIDPLSVSHELVLARAQYLKMNRVINERMAFYEEKIQEGERFYKEHEGGDTIDALAKRDALLFGYAPRLRELESSITSMMGLENRRAIDTRKQLIEEMKLPFHMPSEEGQLIIQVLDLRERNNWDALTTAKHIERLGAKVPPALLLELKATLEEEEDDPIEGGTTIEELDEISKDYYAKQEEYMEKELPKRREEVAEASAKLVAQENGEEFTANDIAKAANEEDEYESLVEASDSDEEGFTEL